MAPRVGCLFLLDDDGKEHRLVVLSSTQFRKHFEHTVKLSAWAIWDTVVTL